MTDVANPEQLLFASTTQAFLEKEASLSRVRELHAADISFDTDWWQRAAELGWASLLVPEELGGGSVSGDGVADLALVAEQIGQHGGARVRCIRSAWCWPDWSSARTDTRTTIEVAGLRRDGRVLGGLRTTPAVRTAAAERHRDPHRRPATASTASRTGSRRAPRAMCCWWSPTATARPRQFLVPADTPGVTVTAAEVRRPGEALRPSANSTASRSTSPPWSAPPNRPPRVIERQRQIALVLQCAEIVGILDTVLDMTTQWLFDRHSFGRPLASYQALKHRFADMKMWFEACRATTARRGRRRWRTAPPTPRSWSASRKPMWPNAPR